MKTTALCPVIWIAALSVGVVACQPDEQTAKTPSENEVKAAIEEYVRQDISLRDAFFLRDPRDESVLVLSFDHVHEQVHTTPEGGYYACVDFKDDAGNIYDVDVYMEATDGDYQPAKLVLHKVNGEAVAQK